MKPTLCLVGLLLLAVPRNALSEVFFCPWADTVVRIELVEGRSRALVETGSGNFDPSQPIPTIQGIKSMGAADVGTVEFSARDGGYHNIFQLEFWSAGVMLNNIRMRPDEDRIFRNYGWCLQRRE